MLLFDPKLARRQARAAIVFYLLVVLVISGASWAAGSLLRSIMRGCQGRHQTAPRDGGCRNL